MAQNVVSDVFNVLRRNKAAAVEKRFRSGGNSQVNRRTRRSAVFDKRLELFQVVIFGISRRLNNRENVSFDLVVDIELFDRLFHGKNIRFGQYRRRRRGDRAQRLIENLHFLVRLGIRDFHLEHESVKLGFRQRIGAFLLNRVLRCHNQKQIVQLIGGIADGYLLFLHRFQQSGLDFRRRAVDFIRQNKVRENRTLSGLEVAGSRNVDHRSQQVGGKKVRGKLNSLEFRVQSLRQRFNCRRFRQPGNAFQKDVPSGQQPD